MIYSALINHVKFPRRPLRLLIKPRFDLIVLKDKGGDAVDHKRAVCLSTLYPSLCSYPYAQRAPLESPPLPSHRRKLASHCYAALIIIALTT